MYYSIAIIVILLAVPAVSYAGFATNLTRPFGGRVLTNQLPVATCIGLGTGPVLLSNNIGSLVNTAISATDNSQGTVNQVSNIASGLYGAIPYYATMGFTGLFVTPLPQTGDWILGRADVIPSLTRCIINGTPIPFPVRNTSTYNVSR
jgi:hypothetical protein